MFFWKKSQPQSELLNTHAMQNAINLLTDASHLSMHCVCMLRVDPGQYSSAVDAVLEISDAESVCGPILREFESFKAEKIAQSVAGKIGMPQMSEEVQTYEKDVNRALAARLLGQNAPKSYPFSNLIEFLKPMGNGNMGIKYPAAVLDVTMRNQRQAFLKILKQKSTETFSNFRVVSSDAESVVAEFN